MPGPKPTSVVIRIMRRAIWVGECLEYQGPAHKVTGYCLITANPSDGLDCRTVLVHRAVFILTVRPLEPDEHVDHTCNNRRCVRREHLEAVTQAENNRRVHERGRYRSRKGVPNAGHSDLLSRR